MGDNELRRARARKRAVALACPAMLAAALAGFPLAPPASAQLSSPDGTYVHAVPGIATLVQLTGQDARVSGTLSSAVLTAKGTAVSTYHCTLSGTQTGAHLTLNATCSGSEYAYAATLTSTGLVLQTQGNGVQKIAFARATVATYKVDIARVEGLRIENISLNSYLFSHNREGARAAFGPPRLWASSGVLDVRGNVIAVVAYLAKPAKQAVPVGAVLRWTGRSWSPIWTSVQLFGGWLGFPSGTLALQLVPGTVSYAIEATPSAGDNWSGAVISNLGGYWHLIPFLVPMGAFGAARDLTTTAPVSPQFRAGDKVTLKNIWDAGACQQSMPFRYDRSSSEFVSAGPMTNAYRSSFCTSSG